MNPLSAASVLALLLGVFLVTIVESESDAGETNLTADRLLTDFSVDSTDLGWYVLNDNVMGGRSDGGFEIEDAQLRFSGALNTSGGGFSSIRTADLRLDLSPYDGIRLYAMGDGRRYTWRLATEARWRGRPINYWAEFETRPDDWESISIPFVQFVPMFRGNRLDGPPLNPEQITGMGLMINDGQDGPFDLRLDSVYAATQTR